MPEHKFAHVLAHMIANAYANLRAHRSTHTQKQTRILGTNVSPPTKRGRVGSTCVHTFLYMDLYTSGHTRRCRTRSRACMYTCLHACLHGHAHRYRPMSETVEHPSVDWAPPAAACCRAPLRSLHASRAGQGKAGRLSARACLLNKDQQVALVIGLAVGFPARPRQPTIEHV